MEDFLKSSINKITQFHECIPCGIMGGYYEKGLPYYFINRQMIKYLDYIDVDDFLKSTDGLLENCIYLDDREMTIKNIMNQLKINDKYELICRITKKDKSYIWLMCKGCIFQTENNKYVLMSVCVDLTEQKELENQLKLYRDTSQGGAFMVKVSPQLPIIYANDIFYEIHEYTKQEVLIGLDNKCENFIHPEDKDKVINFIYDAIDKGQSNIKLEMRVITGKGNIKWIESRCNFSKKNEYIIMAGFALDVTQKHILSEKIRLSEERYRIALKEANINVFEYDILNKTLLSVPSGNCYKRVPTLFCNVPNSLIDGNMIHEDSKEDIISLYSKLSSGISKISMDIKNNGYNNSYYWERITYTVIFDENKNPIRAIGIGEDITKQKEAEINYQRELQLRDNFSIGFIATSRANLNQNYVEVIQTSEKYKHIVKKGTTYDYMTEVGSNIITNLEDKKRYFSKFSREALIKSFHDGENIISMDFRRKQDNGKIGWVNATSRLVKDAINGDIYSYSSIRDINVQKTIELSLPQKAERDSLTGAYNKETTIEMIQDAIAFAHKKNQGYALLIFNIDNFNKMVQVAGYKVANSVIQELYSLIQSKFADPKIIGRIFGDELGIWFSNDINKEEISALSEEIRNAMSLSSIIPKSDFHITISAGLVLCADGSLEQVDLFDKAWKILAKCQQLGGDQFIIYEHNSYISEPADFLNNSYEVINSKDSMGEVLLKCIFLLTSSKNFSNAINEILKNILEYYKAEYVCFLEMSPDNTRIQNIYDFYNKSASYNNDMIKHRSNKYDEKWILFLKSRKRIVINNINEISFDDMELLSQMHSQNITSFYSIDIQMDNCIYGYLSVYNPTKNKGQSTLLDSLKHFISNDINKRKVQEKQEYLNKYDSLTGILNRASYTRYLEQLLPDALISIGVVYIDINGLKNLNNQFGYIYGDKVVSFIANAMKIEFNTEYLFRLAGDEFLGICENLTENAFEHQVNLFKMRVENSYPSCISVGHVWADIDINLDKLICIADEKMLVSKREFYNKLDFVSKRYDPKVEEKLLIDLREDKYEMYLQPKVCISTKTISGAEALVRYHDEEGALVPPNRFISLLEKNGNIHYIDLFIFEQVCSTLYRWKCEGLTLIPISLNFSRSTLLSENLMIEMENIYKKYKIPKEFIEIEITESIGSIESQTIIKIGTEIVKNEYRLSLDDFGAKYSNLAILSAMKLHVLKLDKSLVNDLFSNKNTRIVVKSFLSACKQLNISSVAEGIETREQLDILASLGCDFAQGYFFNKPIPCVDFENMYLRDNILKELY